MSEDTALARNGSSLTGRLRRMPVDRVVIALLAGFILLAVLDRGQLPASVAFLIDALITMAPYFLLAAVFSAYARASVLDALVGRAFGGNRVYGVLAAGLFGALSPFCSCGVIPLIAALLTAGVPLAPVMVFWIASPIMDPEMFILTAAGIGTGFAVAKTAAAFGMGAFAGFAILGVRRMGYFRDPLLASVKSGCGCGAAFNPGGRIEVAWSFWNEAERREVFGREFRSTGRFLGKWLVFAFFLESLMVAYIAPEWIASAVGDGNPFAIPLSAIVGMPSYLNRYAAIPLVWGLLDEGMAPGAAMTFMTAGAVSSVPAAIAVFALVRRPVFTFYLALGFAGSVSAGTLYGMVA